MMIDCSYVVIVVRLITIRMMVGAVIHDSISVVGFDECFIEFVRSLFYFSFKWLWVSVHSALASCVWIVKVTLFCTCPFKGAICCDAVKYRCFWPRFYAYVFH